MIAWTTDGMYEQLAGWTNEQTTYGMKEWVNELTTDGMDDWKTTDGMNERRDERMMQWMN